MPKFRRGTVDVDAVGELDLEELRDRIDDNEPQWRQVVTDDGTREQVLEVGRDPYLVRDDSGDPESLYVRYVLRETSEYRSVADTGEDETRDYEPREVIDFLLTAGGGIAYQGSGSPKGPLGFLFDEPDPRSLYVAGLPYDQADLKKHYEQADRVTKIGFSMPDLEPGDEPADVESLSEAIDEAAAFAENCEFTVGHFHNTRDVRESTLIDLLVSEGEINWVAAVHGGGSSMILSESGWCEFYVPEDVDVGERANIIRNRVEVLL